MEKDLNRRVAEALGYKFDDKIENDYAITDAGRAALKEGE